MEKLYTLKHIKTLILIISLGILSQNLFAIKEECHANFEFEIQGLTVTFTNTSNVFPDDCFWDFGDGYYTTELNPVHTYADSGVYLVFFQIHNDSCYDEIYKIVEIGEIANDDCLAFYEHETTENDFEISFTNQSFGEIDSVLWDFGDGTTSKLLNPVHTYPSEGNYPTCLAIFTKQCFDVYCEDISIEASNDCNALFEYETTENEFEIAYINLSLGDIDSVLWDFGDGSTSRQTNPTHTFAASGDYFTCLSIYANQCNDYYCNTIRIESTDTCKADFSFNMDNERPNVVHFTDESTGNNIVREWDFDDIDDGGSFSNEQNPSHTFPENRTYEVKLKITANNCADEIIKNVQIDVPLNIDFTFQLDSNNTVANTFVFESAITGIYDDVYWDFDHQAPANRETVSHVFPEQNKEYEVCLTAEYHFNDTSSLKKISCKNLTTSEYFNLGGQVFFGDSLLNNPGSTGDTAIAYLYRIDGDNTNLIDTNYYHYLGYYWFAEQLKASYIVKTQLLENATHFNDYAPTYAGNTTNWEEAKVIDLKQDTYREDIYLVEKNNKRNEAGKIFGSVSDLFNSREETSDAVVYLFNMENELIDSEYPDSNKQYSFVNLSPGHYVIKGDITGIHSHSKMAYIADDFKSTNLRTPSQLFPNPANDYCILCYENSNNIHQLNLKIHTIEGKLVGEEHFELSLGTNYLQINLHNYHKGLLLLQLQDGLSEKPIKLLHY